MLIILGNSLNTLLISAYCEKCGIEYKRFYTSALSAYPFYFNDYNNGMMGRVIRTLGIDFVQEEKEHFSIISDKHILTIGRSLHDLFQVIAEIKPQLQPGLEKFEGLVRETGDEWKSVSENNFRINPVLNSAMVKNFMKTYQDMLKQHFPDEEAVDVFLSLVPRKDISFNTAAGYLANQVFDGGYRHNIIGTLIHRLQEGLNKDNSVRIENFGQIITDTGLKRISDRDRAYPYKFIITTVDMRQSDQYLMLIYLKIKKAESLQEYNFLYSDRLKELGVTQTILSHTGGHYQLDVYYVNKELSLIQIAEAVGELTGDFEITGAVSYEELREQYACSNFAGWAFDVQENRKNPVQCLNNNVIDLSRWGTAYFTSTMIALKYMKELSE